MIKQAGDSYSENVERSMIEKKKQNKGKWIFLSPVWQVFKNYITYNDDKIDYTSSTLFLWCAGTFAEMCIGNNTRIPVYRNIMMIRCCWYLHTYREITQYMTCLSDKMKQSLVSCRTRHSSKRVIYEIYNKI